MKIGILTFHSQLNYGGVLQAYALQEVLRGMGHDVQIIDRWPDPENSSLELGYNKLGIFGWAKVVIRSLLGGWEWKKFRRVQTTKRFLRTHLHLTPYHFVNWSDLSTSTSNPSTSTSNLNLDLIIVGSDQVWHTGDYSDPSAYLLEGCPFLSPTPTLNSNSLHPSPSTLNFDSLSTSNLQPPTFLSYAASFGMTSIPPECEAQYRAGLSRFAKLSCRESEGVELCRKLGFAATHVVDPTLLLDPSEWRKLVKPTTSHSRSRIVCYFMDGDVPTHYKSLESYARANKVDIDVFLDSRFYASIAKTPNELIRKLQPSIIHEHPSAGPLEFVQAIADADFVLTDSFHALMFSCIFNKNVRFLRPENAMRRKMFARIEEFAQSCMEGKVVVDDLNFALDSFANKVSYRYDMISERRNKSLEWLRRAILQEDA